MTASAGAVGPRHRGTRVAQTAASYLPPSDLLVSARDTLDRGTRFLAHLALNTTLAQPWPTHGAARVRARYLGNCLRELDTFLHRLLDTVPPHPGVAIMPVRQAAGRVDRLARGRWDATRDVVRLRALGRSRACLWHCNGIVRRPDTGADTWMTAGWYTPASTSLRRYALGERLTPSSADLVSVATFYRQLSHRIARA